MSKKHEYLAVLLFLTFCLSQHRKYSFLIQAIGKPFIFSDEESLCFRMEFFASDMIKLTLMIIDHVNDEI